MTATSAAAACPRLVFSADDFGLTEAVNEGIERAHRDGVLQAASLMVSAPAAADAVARARALPGLRVGLHVVVIEGRATLPAARIPHLVDADGWFGSDQLRRGLAYTLPRVRRELRAEIAAQFAAYAATGLTLHHADAHKHMQMHPVVAGLMIACGRAHGLSRIRVPAEPPGVLRACGLPAGLAARALHLWSGVLRGQLRRAGLASYDHCLGIAATGHMDAPMLLRLLARLPAGSSEIYSHPASRQDETLRALMPGYDPVGELMGLLDPEVRRRAHDLIGPIQPDP